MSTIGKLASALSETHTQQGLAPIGLHQEVQLTEIRKIANLTLKPCRKELASHLSISFTVLCKRVLLARDRATQPTLRRRGARIRQPCLLARAGSSDRTSAGAVGKEMWHRVTSSRAALKLSNILQLPRDIVTGRARTRHAALPNPLIPRPSPLTKIHPTPCFHWPLRAFGTYRSQVQILSPRPLSPFEFSFALCCWGPAQGASGVHLGSSPKSAVPRAT